MPAIVADNQSFLNDEVHRERVALDRQRPVVAGRDRKAANGEVRAERCSGAARARPVNDLHVF
jgi:hypothetical protein